MSISFQILPTIQSETIPATELKNRLGSVIKATLKNKREVVVSSRGVPKVVIMPFDEWEKFYALRKAEKEQAQRQRALVMFRQLRKQVQARNSDLTESQAQQLANRFSREVVEAVVRQRQKKYG